MSLEINLLTKNLSIPASFKKTVGILNRLSLAMLVLFILLVSVVFYLKFSEKQRTDDISVRLASATSKVEKAKPTESLYFAFTSKISAVDEIISERADPVQLIGQIKKSMPKDTQLAGLNYSETGISFTISTTAYENIELMVYSLKNNLTIPFDDITLQYIDKRNNAYESKFILNFPKAKV